MKRPAVLAARLPNRRNIDPAYLDAPFDPGTEFSVPYARTTTIIGFSGGKVRALGLPTDTRALIFDPKHGAEAVVVIKTARP